MRSFTYGLVILGLSCIIAIRADAQIPNQNIVLIDVGLSSKSQVADLITRICSLNPQVIAIDLKFPEPIQTRDSSMNLYEKLVKHSDTTITVDKVIEPGDRALTDAVLECKSKMVFAYEIIEEVFPNGFTLRHSGGTISEFRPLHSKDGFISSTKKENIPDLKSFIAYEEDSTNTFGGLRIQRRYQFGVCTAIEYDSVAALRFIRDNKRVIAFNYQAGKKNFKSYSISEVLKGKVKQQDLKRKIVMIGFMGPGNGDKYFSPWNTKRIEPDIYGIEYQAHIVSQVLESKTYEKK